MQTLTTEQEYSTPTYSIELQMPTIADSDMDWHNKTVLIIEDEKQMANLLATIFGREGATVCATHDGETGLRSLAQFSPDLLLLDMRLPGMDGFEVLAAIRQMSEVPVIIVTAVGQHDVLIGGLLAGADDYLGKPFRRDELLVRSWAAVRRGQMNGQNSKAYDDNHLLVDLAERIVKVKGARVRLTTTEFELLAFLLRRSGQVCTFQQILDHVWIDDRRDSADLVHVFIWQIRQKIEPNPKKPAYVVSEHGRGYRFVDRNKMARDSSSLT